MTVVHVRTWSLAILIAALAMLGPFSIDAYLPAFHAIGREFGVPPIAVQQTLSVYLFAYAFMMLWHGALADAQRRPVAGEPRDYALATLGCVAGNIEMYRPFRALQGLCAGAGIVVGRAIIRDRFHGAEAQRLMSQITLVFGVAPAIAPVLGGVLLNAFGWRAVFWLLLALVIALLTWASKRLPETLPVAPIAAATTSMAQCQRTRRPNFAARRDPGAELRRLLLISPSLRRFDDLLIVSSYGSRALSPRVHRGHDRRTYLRTIRRNDDATPNDRSRLHSDVHRCCHGHRCRSACSARRALACAADHDLRDGQQRHHAIRDAIAARSFSDDARPGVVLAGFHAIRLGGRQRRNDRADTRRVPAFAGLGDGGLYGIEPSTVDYISAPYPIAQGCGR
jgi:hypothetical protein